MSGIKRRPAVSTQNYSGRDNQTFEKSGKANGQHDGPRKRHKRSRSIHTSWLDGLSKGGAGPKGKTGDTVYEREVAGYSSPNNKNNQSVYNGAMAPVGMMPFTYNPYYPIFPTYSYPSYATYYNQAHLSQARPCGSAPPVVLARKFTTTKFTSGPYEWTLPQYLCSAGLGYSPGVLIRRFMFWQDNDRTQFEGHKKRALGELAHWKGHGPSKLRNIICASSDEKATKAERKIKVHDGFLVRHSKISLSRSQATASTQTTYTFTSMGIEESKAFCASTMDLDQLASLF